MEQRQHSQMLSLCCAQQRVHNQEGKTTVSETTASITRIGSARVVNVIGKRDGVEFQIDGRLAKLSFGDAADVAAFLNDYLHNAERDYSLDGKYKR